MLLTSALPWSVPLSRGRSVPLSGTPYPSIISSGLRAAFAQPRRCRHRWTQRGRPCLRDPDNNTAGLTQEQGRAEDKAPADITHPHAPGGPSPGPQATPEPREGNTNGSRTDVTGLQDRSLPPLPMSQRRQGKSVCVKTRLPETHGLRFPEPQHHLPSVRDVGNRGKGKIKLFLRDLQPVDKGLGEAGQKVPPGSSQLSSC